MWHAPKPTSVRLTPIEPGGVRQPVTLALDGSALLRLGRSTEHAPNPWGISDTRVSREHVALSGGAGERPTAIVIGQHPIVLVHDGARRVLERGDAAELQEVRCCRLGRLQLLTAHPVC